MTERRPTQPSYADYADWKAWDDTAFMAPGGDELAAFDAEMAGHEFADKRVLDIGFGNGGFLAYAKQRGAARIAGSETQPVLIERANGAGIEPVALDFAAPPTDDPQFDIVTAWDVAEHLDRAMIAGMFETVCALLVDGGTFVARFPNGQSPLGRIHQHGDPTHLSILSAPIMQQLAAPYPLDYVRGGNPRLAGGAKRKLRGKLQRGYERMLQTLYGTDAPLAPNTIVEFRRRPRG